MKLLLVLVAMEFYQGMAVVSPRGGERFEAAAALTLYRLDDEVVPSVYQVDLWMPDEERCRDFSLDVTSQVIYHATNKAVRLYIGSWGSVAFFPASDQTNLREDRVEFWARVSATNILWDPEGQRWLHAEGGLRYRTWLS